MARRQRGDRWIDLAISVALFAGIWFTRSNLSTAFVTWDEPAWVYRSVKFLMALSRGDFADTLLVGHPGVITMWSGALGLLYHLFITKGVVAEQLWAIDALPFFGAHEASAIRQLVPLLPAAKALLPGLHAAILVVLFWLLRRLLDRRYALVGVLLLALDPYYLGLSRVLHTDALAAGLMLIAVIGLLLRARGASRGFLIGSAVAASLAILAKSYSVFIVGWAGLFLLIAYGRGSGERASRRWLGLWIDLALWGGIAAATMLLVWPAMWVKPLETVREMFRLSLMYAAEPEASSHFFRGEVVEDPGPLFYAATFFFRATPLVLWGRLLALGGLLFRGRGDGAVGQGRRPATVALFAYAVLYTAAISLSTKKYDRYMLPALLAVDLVAALGIVGVLDLVGQSACLRRRLRGAAGRIPAIAGTLAVAAVLAHYGCLLAPLWPAHYLAYYNPLVGGADRAVERIPVGWGEGVEAAARYLADKPDAEQLCVATWAMTGLLPIFPGSVVPLSEETLHAADYVLLYVADVQSRDPLVEQFYARQSPEFVVYLNGIEYAWLYPNQLAIQWAEGLAHLAVPGDVIVLSGPSLFDRRYQGNIPYWVVDAESEEAVAEALRALTRNAHHLIYVEYRAEAGPATTWLRRQLAQSALYLWEQPFSYGVVRYYALPDGLDFRPVQVLTPLQVRFGQQLLLEGYGLARQRVEYRQEIGVGLRWRILQSLDRDLQLFVHLVDEQGRIWGQRDLALSDDQGRGTSAWAIDAAHVIRVTVPLEAGIVPGRYWLEVGLYDLADLSRWPVIGGDDQPHGSAFRFGPIDVVSPTVPPKPADLAIQHPLHLWLGKHVRLLGYALSTERPQSGDALMLMLYWKCAEEMGSRYELLLRLQHEGVTVDLVQAPPAGPSYPTDRWRRREILRYPQTLTIPPGAAAGAYEVYLNLWDAQKGERLLAEDLLLTQLYVQARPYLFQAPEVRFPMRAVLGERVAFLGYDLDTTTLEAGGPLQLTLYWQALAPMEVSYTVFVHLVDAQSLIRSQRDSVPVQGQRPTTGWLQGEFVVDRYELSLAADAPPGTYQLLVGLYDAATDERLPVVSASGESVPERHIALDQPITVR